MSTAALDQLVDSYLEVWWTADPVAATGAGVAEYDHMLGSFDEESVRSHITALGSLAGSLEDCPVDSLDDEIDRTALLNAIRTRVHVLGTERPQERNPEWWLSHALEALHLLLVFRDRSHEHQARAVAGRLRALPEFFAAAAGTLDDCPSVFVRTALRLVGPGLKLVDEVERVAAAVDPEAAVLGEAARGALEGFESRLAELLDGAPADFAIGEEAFNFRLQFEHAHRQTAAAVSRFGNGLIDEVDTELCALAAEIDPGLSWPDLADRLRGEHPPAEGLLDAYVTQMERARAFVEEHDLIAMPSGSLEVVATPPVLRPLVPYAAYQPPGAFSDDTDGWFYVTLPGPGADAGARERALREHAVHDLPGTTVHEGYPGHHLHFLTAHAQPRRVRKIVWSPITVEGWALYCEELMAEQGFYRDPRERLFQRIALLWRAVRVVIDVGLHTRDMQFGEAVSLLTDRLHFDRALAEAEVQRYCGAPVYQASYALGRHELLRLRASFQRAHGDGRESLRAFHDAVLGFGGLPVSLARWGMALDE